MADSTTGGLPAVAEAAIGSLPGIADLYDDTLLPVEQQGEARSMTGRQWKEYARTAAAEFVGAVYGAAPGVGVVWLSPVHPTPNNEWLACSGGAVPGAYKALRNMLGGTLPDIHPEDRRFTAYIYGGKPAEV